MKNRHHVPSCRYRRAGSGNAHAHRGSSWKARAKVLAIPLASAAVATRVPAMGSGFDPMLPIVPHASLSPCRFDRLDKHDGSFRDLFGADAPAGRRAARRVQ